jgi:hypothetical protein
LDAVISWVDGYDPIYLNKLNSFCAANNIDKKKVIEPTRINQHNEIYYCLQSIFHFAPWIQNIYIITNQQIPKALSHLQNINFKNKIHIIDQNDLLKELGIETPIFNSLSAEWLIWGIKGLSNEFLYFNDDFFIIKPVKPCDFFKEGKVILRGDWKTQSHKKFLARIKQTPINFKTNPHRVWQEQSAQLAEFKKKFFFLDHAPFALLKKTFDDFIPNNQNLRIKNLNYPFRNENHTSSIPLMAHLNIVNNRAIFKTKLQAIMVNGKTHSINKIKSRLKKARLNANIAFLCMQSLDEATPLNREYMLNWLEENVVKATL